MLLQGLWWTESGDFDFARKDNWRWTLMIVQPEHVTEEMVEEARQQVERKKPNQALSGLRLEGFHEGPSVQIMHVGPYETEPATVERMHQFARESGYRLHGKHHEIYLGDQRRADPDKLKTVLRQPVEKP